MSRPEVDRRQHCDAHEEFLVGVTKLTAQVNSMRSIFKWTISAMLTVSLFIAGAAGTFAYKVGDMRTQVSVNDTRIAHLEHEWGD